MELKPEFEESGKEDGNSMHKDVEATKNTSHLEDLRGLSGMAGGKNIHWERAERETLEQKVGNRSYKSRFLASPTDGGTIYWDVEYKKSKFDAYVIVCKGVGEKKLGL